MVGARRIRSEKLREHHYKEGYARILEGKGVEGDGDTNVGHMWEQVKRAMVERAREVCGRGRDGLDREGLSKKKRFGCQTSKENGAG